jgi:hypothetical protein
VGSIHRDAGSSGSETGILVLHTDGEWSLVIAENLFHSAPPGTTLKHDTCLEFLNLKRQRYHNEFFCFGCLQEPPKKMIAMLKLIE